MCELFEAQRETFWKMMPFEPYLQLSTDTPIILKKEKMTALREFLHSVEHTTLLK